MFNIYKNNSKIVDLTIDDIYTKFSKIKEYGEENVKEVIEDTKDKLVKTISREIKKSSKENTFKSNYR